MGHIPGPWKTREARGRSKKEAAAGKPERLCFHEIVDEFGKTVASTWGGPNIKHARLIAAAPELLAALIEMMKLRGPDHLTDTERAKIINSAVFAIAKARGENIEPGFAIAPSGRAAMAAFLVERAAEAGCVTRDDLLDAGFTPADIARHADAARSLAATQTEEQP